MKITRKDQYGWDGDYYQVKCDSPFQMLFPASGMPSLIPTPCIPHPFSWLSLCFLCHFLDSLLDTSLLLYLSCCIPFICFHGCFLHQTLSSMRKGALIYSPLYPWTLAEALSKYLLSKSEANQRKKNSVFNCYKNGKIGNTQLML